MATAEIKSKSHERVIKIASLKEYIIKKIGEVIKEEGVR